MTRPKVLFLCNDRVGESMAGPGIRAYELAWALSGHADATIAAAVGSEPLPGVELVTYAPGQLRELEVALAGADAVVTQPQWPQISHLLARSGARLIYDLYDPEAFELMEWLAGRPLLRAATQTITLDRFGEAFRLGHHFMCASEKQRDLWIGSLLAQRLITPEVYDRDPSLQERLARVPFGVPTAPPARNGGPGPRAIFNLDADAELILWNGGIWKWLDAPTAVRAMAELRQRRPKARLLFMGTSTSGPAVAAQEQARAIAAELGLLGEQVLFNDGWVAYSERADWLLEADCAVSTHVEHLETRFAFRTRLLDCFWSGLPIVCTEGDELADRVAADRLGATVPQRDPVAVAQALEQVLDAGRSSYAEQLARAAAAHSWGVSAQPLIDWVTSTELPPRLGGRRRRLTRGAAPTARYYGFRAIAATRDRLGLRR